MVRYKMVGMDFNSSPTQYRTWVVNDTPDFDGYYYAGLKSGPEPLLDVVAYSIADGYAVVDFNLPNPLSWNTSYRVLPKAVYNSQLAIVDGYAYLFGGSLDGYGNDGYGTTNKIFRTDLNVPADWADTGATLPNSVCLSQLAVVDGYMYMFGGLNKDVAIDNIFSAPLTNPLSWTDHGHLLPRNLHSSSLCIADGYLYLYGGYEVNYASEVIFKASVTNPLAWVDTGASLPTKLYGSQLGIVDGYIYLFGGLLAADSPTSNIYRAARTSATSWSVVGAMPMASCYSQFFTVASKGYLIGPTFPTGTLTRILSCNLSTPLLWSDTLKTIPGQVAQSQIGIIGDRLFLFGGNGSSVIFADNSIVKYTPTDPVAVSYGSITRTQYNATANPLDLFKLLGFPYWKTNYGG